MNAPQSFLRHRALPFVLLLPLLAGACVTPEGGQKPVASNDPSVNLTRLARTAEIKGDPRSAAALFEQAHNLSPTSVPPLLALGANLRGQQKDAEAAEAYRRILAIDPRNVEALRGLGMAQIGLNQVRPALDSFDAALHIDTRDAKAWNGRGVALDMLDRHAEAQHAYLTGLSLARNDEALRNNLALSQSLAPKPAPATAAQAAPARPSLAQAPTTARPQPGWIAVSSR